MQAFWLIAQLLIALALGFFIAKRLPHAIIQYAFKLLPYFSYALLISIALEFSSVFSTLDQHQAVLQQGITLAFLTSVGSFACCYLLYKCLGYRTTQGQISAKAVMQSLLNMSYAFIALALGYLLYHIAVFFNLALQPDTWSLLLLFMLLIGLDLAHTQLDRSWLNWQILLVPLACMIGSILAALLTSLLFTQWRALDFILLSQGYGFYTMSSVVISELRGPELGSLALVNDLFREAFAIILMFALGWRYPRSAISSAGATAMDVTLPMVKQACGNDFIPHAMVSGFLLSVLAPIAVSILAAL